MALAPIKSVIIGLRSSLEQDEALHSLDPSLVTSAIRSLLQMYGSHRYDVFTMIPLDGRKMLAQPVGQVLEKILVTGLQKAGTLDVLNQQNLHVSQLPYNGNQEIAQQSSRWIYHRGYSLDARDPKGYVGKTRGGNRQEDHARGVQQEKKRPGTTNTLHYEQAKDMADVNVTIVCLLDEIEKEEIQSFENIVDTANMPGWDEAVLFDQNDCMEGGSGDRVSEQDWIVDEVVLSIAEQVISDLFGSYAPKDIIESTGRQSAALIERGSLARTAGIHALSIVGWIPLYDRPSFAGINAHGLNAIPPWMHRPVGSRWKWTKISRDVGTVIQTQLTAYRKASRRYVFLDLADYQNNTGAWKGTLSISLGKPRRGIDNGTLVTFIVEQVPVGEKHSFAYCTPAGIDLIRHPEFEVLNRVAFRIDWDEQQDYLGHALYSVTNENANKVLDILAYLDGYLDDQRPGRPPARVYEEICDEDDGTVQEARWHVKEADQRRRPVLVERPLDETIALVTQKLTTDFGVDEDQFVLAADRNSEITSYRAGMKSEKARNACDQCLMTNKPEMNDDGSVGTVNNPWDCVRDVEGQGCQRCVEKCLLCTYTCHKVLRANAEIRAFMAPAVLISEGGYDAAMINGHLTGLE